MLNELKRRENAKNELPKIYSIEKIITLLPKVGTFLENNINNIIEEGRPLKDFKEYAFENLLELFYGHDIWDWYNKNCEGE